MDRREPEESSSSPSVNSRIRSIQERGTSGTLLSVVLEEGSSFFVAPELFHHSDSWICPGARLSEERLSRLENLDRETRCRKKALDLLARRAHSRQELSLKLLQRQFPRSLVERTSLWLENKGFLNDREFARQWLRNQSTKGGDSRKALEIKLRKKGVSSEILKDLFSEYPEDREKEALKRAWAKLMRRSSMTEEKALKSLLRKGFSYGQIKNICLDPTESGDH